VNLIELLRAFGASEELIALAERWEARETDADGHTTGWPEGVEALTDDDVTALLTGLVGLAEDDEVGVPLLEAAADTASGLRTEQVDRTEAAAAEEAAVEAQRARLRGEPAASDVEPEGGEGEGDGGEGGEGDAGTGDGEGGDGAGDGATAETGDREPVTAGAAPAGTGARVPLAQLARRSPRRAQPPPDLGNDDHPRAMLRFGADVPDVAAGHRRAADREGLDEVSRAMERRFESFARGSSRGGVEEYLPVATLQAVYPEDRRLVDGRGVLLSEAQMQAAIRQVIEREVMPDVIAAAGGLCAPLMPYYGVEVVGQRGRPVRDEALVSFQASRGGIISMIPPIMTQLAGSIGVWTMDDDVTAASDPNHVKAIIDVVCGQSRTTHIRAITARLRYGNIISRTFGEWTAAWSDLQMVAHDRIAEQQLLADIKAGSKQINLVTTQVEAVRDTVNTLNRAAEGIRSRHRAYDITFRAILPQVWLAIAAESLSKSIPGGGSIEQNLAVAVSTIRSWFTSRGINPTFSPDMEIIGPQATNTALAALPPTIEWALYPEGSWLHLDNGEIDLGVVRDTTSNAQNNYETFSESFEAAHHLGIDDSYWGTLNVCPSGAVVGTLDPAGMCASYT
jgi:hypothetical protein